MNFIAYYRDYKNVSKHSLSKSAFKDHSPSTLLSGRRLWSPGFCALWWFPTHQDLAGPFPRASHWTEQQAVGQLRFAHSRLLLPKTQGTTNSTFWSFKMERSIFFKHTYFFPTWKKNEQKYSRQEIIKQISFLKYPRWHHS